MKHPARGRHCMRQKGNARLDRHRVLAAWLLPALLLACSPGQAAPVEPGRLFYTPAQRAQLEAARSRNGLQSAGTGTLAAPGGTPVPVRFDGMVIRSDGRATRWVDGKPQPGTSSVTGLKPGQIRVGGKVYEPYQVLRPVSPDAAPGADAEDTP